jgi:flagellar assembly protein FliH
MSTSSRLAPQMERGTEIQSFPYAETATSAGRAPAGESSSTISPQEKSQWEYTAREAGRKEGEERIRAQFQQQADQLRESLRAVLHDFESERKQYFARVEEEVVKLALAVAGKILHRETQMDPLVLAGMARVAMDKLDSATSVVLRVHPVKATEWREYFARQQKTEIALSIEGDASLVPGSCVLQTSLGTMDLSIAGQLQEIEKGFADLLAQRPR